MPICFVFAQTALTNLMKESLINCKSKLAAGFVDRLCGPVVRVPGCRTDMYCVSCEVRTDFMYVIYKKVDRICGLVVRVPGYTTEMNCVSCEVQAEFIYVM
jgi:hypothetical protein